MSIAQTSTINPTAIIAGLLQSTDHAEAPKELVDPDDPSPYLEDYWNWCIIDDCRPITKAGRLFSRRGHRQYRLVEFSLMFVLNGYKTILTYVCCAFVGCVYLGPSSTCFVTATLFSSRCISTSPSISARIGSH